MSYKIDRVDWSKETDQIKQIKDVREKVFILEHRIPINAEFDNKDADSVHVLIKNEDDKPVATGRICQDGKISRIAVLKKYRQTNAADQVIRQLVNIAHKKGFNNVLIDAELDYIDDFKQQGFKPKGSAYMDAGVAKQTLSKAVNNFACPRGILH